MNSSISPKRNGFILDTNILSLFAKVNSLNILQQFATLPLYITPVIQQELEAGLKKEVHY